MFIIRVQFLNYEYFSAFYNCLLSSLQDSCDIFGFSDEQTQAWSESFVQREELFPICRTLAFFQFPKNAKKLHWFCRLSTNKNRVGTSTQIPTKVTARNILTTFCAEDPLSSSHWSTPTWPAKAARWAADCSNLPSVISMFNPHSTRRFTHST